MAQNRQALNDGLLTVYAVSNVADPGKQPVEGLKEKIKLAYHERTVGMSRHYAAKQAQTRISMLVRTHERREVTEDDVVKLRDGEQYDIEQIQYIEDSKPPMMDLTLRRRALPYAIKDGLP